MSTPTALAARLADLGDKASGLATWAEKVYDRPEVYEFDEFASYVCGAARDMVDQLDRLVEHLAKLGVVTPAKGPQP